ncbi:hypothetical protein CIB93_16155 [Streptomyces sp. WZ.A104]|nr:hypothetical protein CIB93_16155 [Streptomyces sp. WZ.A104]
MEECSGRPGSCSRGDQRKERRGVLNRTMRTYDEAVDDVVAASVGRSRMADGRRIELSVEELALMVRGAEERPGQES